MNDLEKEATPNITPNVYEELKTTKLDIWKFSEYELIQLMLHIFKDTKLQEGLNIGDECILTFLNACRKSYNKNPFHNFQHCFCVTQMVKNSN
jgi:high affinity cGMP-specific 3',5'-cyclic phosphodiesterase 9